MQAYNVIVAATEPVSVIICAKNEAANLQRHLPAILGQRYTNEAGVTIYEVIMVDDASTDETAAVLRTMQEKYPHLRIVTISKDAERDVPGKKYALGKGIAAAKYDNILVTDADCLPASDNWLSKMVSPLQNGKLLAAGYGKYRTQTGLLNSFIRWETLHTFLQYSTYAITGHPYMATGRNLAYKKQAFLNAQQTKAWAELPSGDDDLLISANAMGNSMAVVAARDAFTISDAKSTWGDWIAQKQRHVSAGKYYKLLVKLLLGGYALSHALTWLCFFPLLFTADTQMVTGVMLCRCMVYWMLWHKTAKTLDEKGLSFWLPVMDIGWMLYNFVLSPYIFWKNKTRWK